MTVDLGQLENDLNTDEMLLGRFLQNPVATLQERGLKLSADMEQRLQAFVQQLKNPDQNVAGASVARNELAREVGVGISIGKSF